MGWRLAGRAWHHGYATEAAAAAVGRGVRRGRMTELWSITAALNTPSQAVMRRIGMRPYAEFEHPRIEAGHWLRPHVVFRKQRLWVGGRADHGPFGMNGGG